MAAIMSALVACAPTKARVDYTYSGGILWPGGDQPPRIRYLWSLSRISGATDEGVLDLIAGGEVEESEDLMFLNMLQRPHSVFVDRSNRLYITDPGAGRVSVVDLNTMDSFQIDSFLEIPFSEPIGVATLPDGRIVISDPDLKLVGFFRKDGMFEKFLRGQFRRPTALAIDVQNEIIYVTDTWEHTIYKYDWQGNQVGSIGEYGEEPGQFSYPTHIAVDGQGLLYVADTLNFRVQVLTPAGEPVTVFGLPGDIYGRFDKIKGIAVDTEGHIYIADSLLDMIQIFDREGRLLLFFGEKGNYYGQFMHPTGIFIDSSNRIFVADALNRRVQVFEFLGGED